MFLTTGAVADVGGRGECRAYFLLWQYIYENGYSADCNSLVDDYDFCATIGEDNYDCYAVVEDLRVKDLCNSAKNATSPEEWLAGAVEQGSCVRNNGYYTKYVDHRPYHLRWETYDDARNDELWTEENESDQTSIRCYNDDVQQLYLTICDCYDYGNAYGAYPPCPTGSILSDPNVGICSLDKGFGLSYDGETTLLCVPFEQLFNEDGCEICNCGGGNGTAVAGGWNEYSSGLLQAYGSTLYDLNNNVQDILDGTSWGVRAYGCATVDSYVSACNTGYYQTGDSTCAACPTHASGGQTSAYANTGGISVCYVPAGDYSDATGSYTFTQNCKY